MVIIGRFTSPYGIKGWIKVQSFAQTKQDLFTYNELSIERQGSWQPLNIAEYRQHGSEFVVKLAGCDDRQKASTYTNCLIGVDRAQLPRLAEHDYYWADLEGLTVVNREKQVLGTVAYLMATGSNDVLVVKSDHSEHLLPYTESVVDHVDLQQSILHVCWPLDDDN